MYHVSVPWSVHNFLLSTFSCITTFVPGGAIGVLLTSKLSSNAAYADNDGLHRNDCNKMIVILHWGRSQSHSLEGNFVSQVNRPATK